MARAKIAITIERELLSRLNRFVKEQLHQSRSGVIQDMLRDKLDRLDRNRLARECAKLEPKAEQRLADEGSWRTPNVR